MPYINIDSEDAKKVNQEIYKIYEDLIEFYNLQVKNQHLVEISVSYKSFINNNILSVIITTTKGVPFPMKEFYTYNFDLENGNLLSYEDIYKSLGYTKENIDNNVAESISDIIVQYYNSIDECKFEINHSMDIYKKNISNNNIGYFIDDNKKLNIISNLYHRGQTGGNQHLITIK